MSNFFGLEIDVPESELEYFFENATSEQLKKDAYFHSTNSICRKIGIVKSGLLKSFVIDERGNEKIVEFYAENAFVSAFTSFLTQETSDWNIQAMEDVEIITLSKAYWKTFTLEMAVGQCSD